MADHDPRGHQVPEGECLSISHISTGGVIIDLFTVSRFSFGRRAVRRLFQSEPGASYTTVFPLCF